MSERVCFTVDQKSGGGLQLSINVEREDGCGHGYRIHGPKYDGSSKTLLRHYLTERDVSELRVYLTHALKSQGKT